MTGPDGVRPTAGNHREDPGVSRSADPTSTSTDRIVLREVLLLSTIGVALVLLLELLGLNDLLDGLNALSPVADHALEILGLLAPVLLGLLLLRTIQARRTLARTRTQARALDEDEALLRQLAEAHGGLLVVEGGGPLRFVLDLPRLPEGTGVASG